MERVTEPGLWRACGCEGDGSFGFVDGSATSAPAVASRPALASAGAASVAFDPDSWLGGAAEALSSVAERVPHAPATNVNTTNSTADDPLRVGFISTSASRANTPRAPADNLQ